MKEILLTQGKIALVDDEDFEFLNQWKWCAHKVKRTYYAGRTDTKRKKNRSIGMHRIILKIDSNIQVDHKNGDGLDNRKENLRICTNQENQFNRKNLTIKNISGYKGVSWHMKSKKWQASICYNKYDIYLGLFKNKKDAAKAYNEAAEKYFGKFAAFNKII